MHIGLICCILLIRILAGGTLKQYIRIPPEDATHRVGEEAKFECVTHFESFLLMKWEYNGVVVYSLEDGVDNYLLNRDKYIVERYGKTIILTVTALQLLDGGTYTCRVATDHYDANLIVLGPPKIKKASGIITENHHFTYTCNGQFGGPPKEVISPGHYPKMNIFLDGTLVAIKGNIKELGPKNGSNAHTLQKNYSTPEMDKKTIKCEISTDIPAGSNTADQEIIVPEKEPE